MAEPSPTRARGPECVDPFGQPRKTWFADWKLHENGLSVMFRMWEVKAWDDDGALFVKRDTGECSDLESTSRDPLECTPVIEGWRKFDGCTEWRYDDEFADPLHVCDMAELGLQQAALRNTFRVCAEMIGDRWQGGAL